MRGLLLKDFYGTKQMLKLFLGILVVAFALSFFMDVGMYLLMYTAIFGLMIPLQSMSEDEKSNWNKYAIALPFSRRAIVFSKYAISFICIGCSCVGLFLGMYLSPSLGESMTVDMILGSLAVSVIYILLMIPLILKYGTGKTRMLIMFAFYVPLIIVYLVGEMGLSVDYIDLLETYIYIVPILIVILFIISLMISVRICATKEF